MNTMNKDKNSKPCPCGSGQGFIDCCGSILNGDRDALTGEALIRSRYTAVKLAAMAY